MTLTAEFDRALVACQASGFEHLAPRDQLLVAIWALEADVNNGGFHQFYLNSSGDVARLVPTFLRQIGALEMARIVENANAVFGPDGPPSDRTSRQRILLNDIPNDLEAWAELDEQFWAYPDDIASLLVKHLGLNGVA